ncbi:MAG: pyrroloquinoline quinone biosynthesis peptide chaperone PqqD [Acetobacteraceae bacterium]|nr:pyrroloquinoline quinone biosynthesis peptide chaperone PqqD [Acetobacteraceae bacterium]
MTDSAVPRFAAGMKFRFDTVRERWVVLGPERLFLPDEHAVEILKLVDGQRSLDDIADALAARFDAPRETIAADVAAMLRDLAEKGAIRL